MVLIICTKNELNLTNRYWDMVPDRQKVRTDGRKYAQYWIYIIRGQVSKIKGQLSSELAH